MADTGYPNYLTVGADGTVGAVFPGGVTIPAGTNLTPPDERKIRWLRDTDGALVAQIIGWTAGTAAEQQHSAVAPGGVSRAQLTLDVDDSAAVGSQAIAQAVAVGANSVAHRATIIDDTDRSSFARLGAGVSQRLFSLGAVTTALAAGWNTVDVPMDLLSPPAAGSFVWDGGVLGVAPAGANTITSHQILSFLLGPPRVRVNVNSTVVQNVSTYVLAWGHN